MGETDHESVKHLCKICNKSFPSGRSLGGHMRSHVINSIDHHHHGVKKKGCLRVLDKLCKECGKGFQSWKALFGHMKCHSIKLLNNKSKNLSCLNQDSFTSHSDMKNHRIKRSRLRNRPNKRYMVDSTTTASSSISMNAKCNQICSNNVSASMVSEIEQEQEADVAMSLMMLSRDLGKRDEEFESSGYYNSSVLLNLSEVEGKNLIRNGSKMKNLEETQVGFDFLGGSEAGLIKIDEFDSGFGEFEDSSKGKFDCGTCNKSFHSYQALGGHKASHKKVKGGFDSNIQHENKLEHKPVLEHHQKIDGFDSKGSNNHQESSSFNLGVVSKTLVMGGHQCSICLKVFSSGQALGGHKRTHLVSEGKSNQESNTDAIKKPDERVNETRGFIDLNMPPEEEEMNMSSSTTDYKSFYLGDKSDHHSHESRLLCLLSTK